MPGIETQGLSVDYATATGSFDVIDRGEVTRAELEKILETVSGLVTPPGDDMCPPSINAMLSPGHYSCFYGDAGVIRCTDSQQETMTPAEAAAIISGEITLEDFDRSRGFAPRRKAGPGLVIVAVAIALVIAVMAVTK